MVLENNIASLDKKDVLSVTESRFGEEIVSQGDEEEEQELLEQMEMLEASLKDDSRDPVQVLGDVKKVKGGYEVEK